MSAAVETAIGTVAGLERYPVKSMWGETRNSAAVTARGLAGDRIWAVIDQQTGKVASAKRPQLWRGLLACSAQTLDEPDVDGGSAVEITMPQGPTLRAGDPALDARLSEHLRRPVRLSRVPAEDASLDRSYPEDVLAQGLDAEVGADLLQIAAAAPGTFFDFAPIHLITTATLDALRLPDGPVEPERYRPNIIVRSAEGARPFPENAWIGASLLIGEEVAVRVLLSTPRCAIPTLAQGPLPVRHAALRVAAERNSVEIEKFGVQACAGIYVEVLRSGSIRTGDPVRLAPA